MLLVLVEEGRLPEVLSKTPGSKTRLTGRVKKAGMKESYADMHFGVRWLGERFLFKSTYLELFSLYINL